MTPCAEMTAITLYLTSAIERPYQSSTWGKKALMKGKKTRKIILCFSRFCALKTGNLRKRLWVVVYFLYLLF